MWRFGPANISPVWHLDVWSQTKKGAATPKDDGAQVGQQGIKPRRLRNNLEAGYAGRAIDGWAADSASPLRRRAAGFETAPIVAIVLAVLGILGEDLPYCAELVGAALGLIG